MAKVGLDNFQRANYLYQLAWAAMRTRPDRPAASHHYSHMLVEFGQKAVLRMEPGLKRTMCAACHVLLVPGTTCTVRTRSRPQRCQVWRCKACGQCRRFPCPRPTDKAQRRKISRKAQTASAERGTVQEPRMQEQEMTERPAQKEDNGDSEKINNTQKAGEANKQVVQWEKKTQSGPR